LSPPNRSGRKLFCKKRAATISLARTTKPKQIQKFMKTIHRFAARLLFLLTLGLFLLTAARAETFTVTTTADGGAGSLRDAIAASFINPLVWLFGSTSYAFLNIDSTSVDQDFHVQPDKALTAIFLFLTTELYNPALINRHPFLGNRRKSCNNQSSF
jgi:heme A synthase